MRRVFCTVLLAAALVRAGDTLAVPRPPTWRPGRVAAEAGAGVVGGLGGALVGGVGGVVVGYVAGAGEGEYGSLVMAVFAACVGAVAYPFGAAFGVNWLGRRYGERGNYWAAFAGGLAGAAAVAGVWVAANAYTSQPY